VNPGYQLVDNVAYPQIARDYERTFRVLNSLPCDVFLGAHGSYYGMEEKYARLKEGPSNPFLDAEGYRDYIAKTEQAFHAALKKQVAAKNQEK
jgi:metallo-beta-lactamase class B